VGYISAHGTGTQANDATESAAIHQVFGERASKIPISSTKALHGHSIGASGALEALATTLGLQEGRMPQNGDIVNPDPSLDLDVIIGEPRTTGPTLALSNSLAFGGLNAVIALRSWR
jgi:3-oxoacyl-[acyl-carrier-protein] synthase II/nodulation protein E